MPARSKRMYERRNAWLRTGDVTREQLQAIWKAYAGKCAYCGIPVMPRYTPCDPRGFDHVVPRIRGGKHTAMNIVVCCRRCNELKKDS